jgi:hypothetical protein
VGSSSRSNLRYVNECSGSEVGELGMVLTTVLDGGLAGGSPPALQATRVNRTNRVQIRVVIRSYLFMISFLWSVLQSLQVKILDSLSIISPAPMPYYPVVGKIADPVVFQGVYDSGRIGHVSDGVTDEYNECCAGRPFFSHNSAYYKI